MIRDQLILEGIITTQSMAGEVNIAPMGPRCDARMSWLTLRPFKTSTTYQNLKECGEGVFHVVDDVLLLAQAAIGKVDPPPMMLVSMKVQGFILQDACRFYEFKVEKIDDSQERAEMEATVVGSGRIRDFFGFNRAKHAVVEAAILATRVHLLPRADMLAELARLDVLVEKTGGRRERQAFALLRDYIQAAPPLTGGQEA
jgi:hypothetical protein